MLNSHCLQKSVYLCCLCLCVCLTWSLFHSRLNRPLLIEERRKCIPWSAIRKFRSPNQKTTLKCGTTAMCVRKNEREQTLSNLALTCGQELVVCCTYRSLVCQVYNQIHPFVAGRSSYEPPDDSSENTACDRRMRNVQTHHLYFPVAINKNALVQLQLITEKPHVILTYSYSTSSFFIALFLLF